MFKAILESILAGKQLSREEASAAMGAIVRGELPPASIAAFAIGETYFATPVPCDGSTTTGK